MRVIVVFVGCVVIGGNGIARGVISALMRSRFHVKDVAGFRIRIMRRMGWDAISTRGKHLSDDNQLKQRGSVAITGMYPRIYHDGECITTIISQEVV